MGCDFGVCGLCRAVDVPNAMTLVFRYGFTFTSPLDYNYILKSVNHNRA